MRRIVPSLLPALLLLGCGDTLYSIASRGTLPAVLDVRCIAEGLAGDPDGANARLIRPDRTVPPIGPKAGDPGSYTWVYGEGSHSYITIERQPVGWTFLNERFYLGDHPEAFGMFRFEPVMKRVNAALAARCGLRITEPGLS